MNHCRQSPISVVLLAKESSEAKSRLRLEPGLTRDLALHLADHTLRAVLEASTTGPAYVVTSDVAIGRNASRLGAVVVQERRPRGMNPAAEMGRRRALAASPHASVAVVVADLPCLQPQDVDAAVEEFRLGNTPMYVADHQGTGTTFLIHGAHARPAIAFGRDSAHMHEGLGYWPALRALPGLRQDLDIAEDLELFSRLDGVVTARARFPHAGRLAETSIA